MRRYYSLAYREGTTRVYMSCIRHSIRRIAQARCILHNNIVGSQRSCRQLSRKRSDRLSFGNGYTGGPNVCTRVNRTDTAIVLAH